MMRTEFIQCETIEQAREAAPWAAEIIEVEGGFRAFESVEDARIWREQV
ncbi:hypothetical protein [Burkholderia pseudomallei]|nr:hypothetical protein [Burkholderia pseudomallei]